MNARPPSRTHPLIAATVTVIGALLMAAMVHVEGEPGAIPLLLVVGGTVWFTVAHARRR